jgi:DNA topoisomerase IA
MAETRDYRGDDMSAKAYDYCVESGKLSSSVVQMVVGAERARMVPTQLGSAVIKWLEENGYCWLLEPAFTGEVEKRLDLVTDVHGRRILLQDIWARMSATACM